VNAIVREEVVMLESPCSADFETEFSSLLRVSLGAAERVLGRSAAAEDVAAEALARLWVRWDKLGSVGHRDAWLVVTSTNLAVDVVRKRTPQPKEATATQDCTDMVVLRMTL
jgi:DNA-directed RNA polymerase specialized sigma24 family protein